MARFAEMFFVALGFMGASFGKMGAAPQHGTSGGAAPSGAGQMIGFPFPMTKAS